MENDWHIRVKNSFFKTDQDIEKAKEYYEEQTGFEITVQEDESAIKFKIDQTKPI